MQLAYRHSTQIQHNREATSWPAIFKRGRRFQLGTTENNWSSKWPERDCRLRVRRANHAASMSSNLIPSKYVCNRVMHFMATLLFGNHVQGGSLYHKQQFNCILRRLNWADVLPRLSASPVWNSSQCPGGFLRTPPWGNISYWVIAALQTRITLV